MPTFEDLEVLAVTDDALLLDFDGDEIWIPKSQMTDCSDEDAVVGDLIDIEIPKWLADKEGLD